MKIACNFQLLLGFVVLFTQQAEPGYFSIQYGNHNLPQQAEHGCFACFVFVLLWFYYAKPESAKQTQYDKHNTVY